MKVLLAGLPRMAEFDFIVIGAGIAGASVAAHLAEHASVAVLDMEERAGYHTTGRSAASYEPNYGPPAILALTRASRGFFVSPPKGFAEAPIFTKRGSMVLEPRNQSTPARPFLSGDANVHELGLDAMLQLVPILRPDYAARGFYDDSTGDLDVDLLHRGFLRLFKQRGGKLNLSAATQEIARVNGAWRVATPAGSFSAKTMINAAGAWGDVVAMLGSVAPIGLIPKRRSIGVIPVEGYSDFMNWPMMVDVDETWYAKPQSGKLIVSSADATPVEPHDAYADDEAIALGIDRLMQATTMDVKRLEHSWAGLRTFSPDGSPVVGFDPSTEDFFWLVGQGGYGIQSSWGLSRLASALAMRDAVPEDLLAEGLLIDNVLPERFYK